MANSYGIAPEIEGRVRARDKKCVYCHVKLRPFSQSGKSRGQMATIEHLHNGKPWDEFWNLAMCCCSCNGSKGVKSLPEWLKSDYCQKKKISRDTVAQVVRCFMAARPHPA